MNNGELKTLNGMHVQLKKTEQEPPQTPEGCGRMVAAEYWAYRYSGHIAISAPVSRQRNSSSTSASGRRRSCPRHGAYTSAEWG